MNYLSICSGIEAASVAWHPLGWKPVGFSEIEPFPSSVLKHHYPEVTNYGDMTKYEKWKINDTIDLVCGGTPCQSFSIAGLRKGLEDPRGNLALTFIGILERIRPKWVVWENVCGVLSADKGRAFGSFLGGLEKLGYGWAYRTLDAQYFGVAQRRRRVFVVGYLGDWKRAGSVLFEPESLRGDIAPCRKKRKSASSGSGSELEGNGSPIVIDRAAFNQGKNALYAPKIEEDQTSPCLIAKGPHAVGLRMLGFGDYLESEVASTMKARDYKDATDLVAVHGTQDPDIQHECAHTLGRNQGQENAIAFAENSRGEVRLVQGDGNITGALSTGGGKPGQGRPCVQEGMRVRRLTPIECERLQGFPDNYTQIEWRGKARNLCPDGPRYKALGNSWAVPVVRWIGKNIQYIENL